MAFNGTQTIEVKRLSPALGAEVRGVDLSKPVDDRTWAEVHKAFLEHLVLFFPSQRLTPEQQIAFGRRFGTLNVHPYVEALEGYPRVPWKNALSGSKRKSITFSPTSRT